jgi:hypothetical protein
LRCNSEELLIDFRELAGEHSGENMAEAVWETLKQYDLIGQVSLLNVQVSTIILTTFSKIIALVMDNATNNNTLAVGIEWCSEEAGMHFSAMDSHMCCMPHTVHLAAIKVCVGFPTGYRCIKTNACSAS